VREYYSPQLNRWIVYFNRNHRVYRYRYRMEQHLGRPLRTSEHVHHINGDPTDDRLENLVVMDESEHHRHHAALAREALAANPGPWSRDYPRCIECGTTELKHTGHGQCSRCYYRNLNRAKRGHSPRKPAVVITKTCPQCGEQFTKRGAEKQTIYCSQTCAWQATPAKAWAARRANGTDRGWKRPDVSTRHRAEAAAMRAA
jgi:hypothetical protein